MNNKITEETKIPCTMCNGEGEVPTVRSGYKKCSTCGGSGEMPLSKIKGRHGLDDIPVELD